MLAEEGLARAKYESDHLHYDSCVVAEGYIDFFEDILHELNKNG